MNTASIKVIETAQERQAFMRHVLQDVQALEYMLEHDMFERGSPRLGAEQELNFVDRHWRPSPIGPEVLQRAGDDKLTSEYARFNLEINLDPIDLGPQCLRRLRSALQDRLAQVRELAGAFDADIALVGILPSIRRGDVTLDALNPDPRYQTLFHIVHQVRGPGYEFNIKGLDELISRDDAAVFGGCFTSFQVHQQVDPADMVERFNWAQIITGPLLAAATYSPLFLGKRLWRETRVALFEQTTDFRAPYKSAKGEKPRVIFGDKWVRQSVLEVFQEDIANHQAYIGIEVDEDSLALARAGQVPHLDALSFHNGTIYRWNRPCYGVTDGKPHLRIENRVLPAGPTVEDQVANAALFLGLMNGMPEAYRRFPEQVEFEEVNNNFLKAARLGLDVEFAWNTAKPVPARELLLNELLPMARDGLRRVEVDDQDADHYLGIIEERVSSGQTGSQWMLDSFTQLKKEGTVDEALVAITAALVHHQNEDRPVHTWPPARLNEAGGWQSRFARVEQIMTPTVYTVRDDDVIDLATHLMKWEHIGHVPVENQAGELVGLIDQNVLVAHLAGRNGQSPDEPVAVRDLMVREPVTVTPDMPVPQAIRLLLDREASCLPVVEEGRVVGIVTHHDLVKVASHLLEEP